MKKLKLKISIKHKLVFNTYIIMIPLAILIGYLIFSLIQFGNAYNQIVKNVTIANSYNINFKDQVDYSMYKIVIGSVKFRNIEKRGDINNPYELIDNAHAQFTELKKITVTKSNLRRIDMLLKDLDTLTDRIDDIRINLEVSGNYDENINLLEMNIYILTEIIQEQIQDYIYYEASNFEIIRSKLETELQTAAAVSILAFGIIIIISIIVSGYINQSITKPVSALCMATKQVSGGNFSIRVKANSTDELSGLAESFNNMTVRLGQLVEDIKTEKDNKRLTELRLLQTQINPHFLYNTLDTISWLAEGKQTQEVVSMISSISRFFRIVLSEGRDFITIKEEESHIRSYLEIQKIRYQDILEYEINIDPRLYEYTILKLTLQPLVENALYHGIKEKRGMGRIEVSGKLDGNEIIFLVTDNGIGITPEELDKLTAYIKSTGAEEYEGFGLHNVDERLQLNYGACYGLDIESKWGIGTIVNVRIPAEKMVNSQ